MLNRAGTRTRRYGDASRRKSAAAQPEVPATSIGSQSRPSARIGRPSGNARVPGASGRTIGQSVLGTVRRLTGAVVSTATGASAAAGSRVGARHGPEGTVAAGVTVASGAAVGASSKEGGASGAGGVGEAAAASGDAAGDASSSPGRRDQVTARSGGGLALASTVRLADGRRSRASARSPAGGSGNGGEDAPSPNPQATTSRADAGKTIESSRGTTPARILSLRVSRRWPAHGRAAGAAGRTGGRRAVRAGGSRASILERRRRMGRGRVGRPGRPGRVRRVAGHPGPEPTDPRGRRVGATGSE